MALGLFSLAALRVSARPVAAHLQTGHDVNTIDSSVSPFEAQASDPAGAQLQVDDDATVLNSSVSPSQPPVRAAHRPATANLAGAPPGSSAIDIKCVVWGKAVDGLEPGFLLTTPSLTKNRHVPFNSYMAYKVLVRNTTGRAREFEVHCRDIYGMDTYLIPDDDFRKALGGSKIPENYRAGGIIETAVLYPAYVVKLSPGEAVVLPQEFGLYVGDADKQSFPRMESVKAGKNWIVQPITIHRLTGGPAYPAPNTVVMTVDRAGKTTQRSIPAVVAGSGGTQLFARIQVELDAPIASAAIRKNNTALGEATAWGTERNGLQLGLRLPKGVTAFPALSQARFVVLLRNRSGKSAVFPWMGYPTIAQFSPELFTSEGKPIRYIKTIAGPYMNQSTNLNAGEMVVLGTISLPEGEERTLDAFPANTYSAEFALGDTLQGQTKETVKARIVFMVTGQHVDATVPSGQEQTQGAVKSTNVQPATSSVVRMENVVWGKAEDGLEPGFLLTTPNSPNNRGVPRNSLVSYKALVRNTTNQERIFELRCVNSNGLDVPYLIPSDVIAEALSGREIPAQYRAVNLTEMYIAAGAYDIKLGPGETVVVPRDLTLYIGDGDKNSHPRVETIKPGMNWIVQPITIRKMTDAEIAEAELILSTPYSQKMVVTIVDRNGKSIPRSVPLIGAGSGGRQIFAKIQCEVGTLDADAVRSANAAIWGKVDKGLQCGIRMLSPRRKFLVGNTLKAEILYRNASRAPINTPLPRTLDLYPIVRSGAGKEILVDFGARVRLYPISQTLLAGEVRSLGVAKINVVAPGTPSPTSFLNPAQIALAPGVYRLSSLGGVSAANGGAPESGVVQFEVIAN